MIIDFHTHAFPDRIAGNALKTLVYNAGNMRPTTDGTAGGIRSFMKQHGIDRSVVMNIATNPKQQKNVNDFAISINGTDLFGFGSVHPDSSDIYEELHRLKEAGIKGIKLHPDYQGFFVDEQRMIPIYEAISALGFITVFHAGIDGGLFEPVHCPPEKLARVLPFFKDSIVVAAHFGGYLQWYDVEKHLVGKNIYFDTSMSFGRLPKDQAKRIIKNHGTPKILLGSDIPWSRPDLEILFLQSLMLTESQLAAVLGGNAARLLNISE